MIKKQVYEQPSITVLQLEETCGLLAGSEGSDNNVTVDGNPVISGSVEGNPSEGVDSKKNNPWSHNLWND